MRIALIAIGLAALAGCQISEDEAGQRWDDWVAEHNTCEVASDCVVVYPGCPLGCFTAVSAEFEQQAGDESDRILRAYERGGRACDYDCLANTPPTCDAGVCAVEASEEF